MSMKLGDRRASKIGNRQRLVDVKSFVFGAFACIVGVYFGRFGWGERFAKADHVHESFRELIQPINLSTLEHKFALRSHWHGIEGYPPTHESLATEPNPGLEAGMEVFALKVHDHSAPMSAIRSAPANHDHDGLYGYAPFRHQHPEIQNHSHEHDWWLREYSKVGHKH